VTESAILDGFRALSIAAVADALDDVTGERCFMDSTIAPRICGGRILGPAATVMTAPTGERAVHAATMTVIDEALPGSILVLGVEDERNAAIWDSVWSAAAAARGLVGAVTDGAVRDLTRMRAIGGFEVFAAALTPGAGFGRIKSLVGNVEIECGGLVIRPGDLILGDVDGVVAIPADKAAAVLAAAQDIERRIDDLVSTATSSRSAREAMQRHWPRRGGH